MKKLSLFIIAAVFSIVSFADFTYTVLGVNYYYDNNSKFHDELLYYHFYTDDNGQNVATVLYADPDRKQSVNGVLYAHRNYGKIVIPSTITAQDGKTYTVTTLADGCFYKHDGVSYVIPNTVVTIGHRAFYECKYIGCVELGTGVKYIGDEAFYCCGFCGINLNSNVETIGDRAFYGTYISSLNLPASLRIIGQYIVRGDFCGTINWNLNKSKLTAEELSNKETFLPNVMKNALVRTKTTTQAEEARKLFTNVFCEAEANYPDKIKYYTELQYQTSKQSTSLADHYATLRNGDVNEDGKVNSADVVNIYNRIINGQINSYRGQTYVDLGLPSGTLWATCNLGASTPDCAGDYFAWGTNWLVSYKFGLIFSLYGMSEETYIAESDEIKNMTTGEIPADKSSMCLYSTTWGGNWKMPTTAQAAELNHNCNQTIETVKGTKCQVYTSKKNGNKVYFPLVGKIDNSPTPTSKGEGLFYWTSTADAAGYAWHLSNKFYGYDSSKRYVGMPIRPVVLKSELED